MPILPISIKFYPAYRRVLVVALMNRPNANKLRVLRGATMKVTVGGSERAVTAGTGYIMDKAGAERIKFVILNFRYADANGNITEDQESIGKGILDSPAELEITITNTPNGGDPDQALLALTDPSPNGIGNPPDGDIDLFLP